MQSETSFVEEEAWLVGNKTSLDEAANCEVKQALSRRKLGWLETRQAWLKQQMAIVK